MKNPSSSEEDFLSIIFSPMHLLLLTDDPKKGQFVVSGLRYENLFVDMLSLAAFQQWPEKELLQYDGLLLFLNDVTFLESIIAAFLQVKPNLPIMILALEYHALLRELFDHQKIKRFFIRPFPFRLIAAEMRSFVFQERECIQNGIVKIRDLELNREAHEIRLFGRNVYLRNKEFALLEFLMLNTGKVLSRGTILEHVWDRNANIFTNTVDVHINKLRKKIDNHDTERFIRTIPCSGYLLA